MTTPTVLVLAGTGKTGARVARRLRELGVDARPAARRGAGVRFDWDDPTTFDDALAAVDRVYLVPPGASVDFVAQVRAFLDRAERAGIAHVTYLSARGAAEAPDDQALRAVELELQGRDRLGHTVLRPAWFMQNFTESFLLPGILEQRAVIAPTGDGAEPFVDTEDLSAVAAATLVDPEAHRGRVYTLTGPAALSMADAAREIATVLGEDVTHLDVDRAQWLRATIDAGVPADYAEMLASLLDTIRSGVEASVTDDVREVLHREPTSFRAFAQRSVDSWRR